MTDNQIDYHDLARIQIDTAIRLYNEANYVCAVVLAHAAEGFLGKVLDKDSSHHELKFRLQEKYPNAEFDLNMFANFLKHGGEDRCERTYDIRLEAIQYICRAITNYNKYSGSITEMMDRFFLSHKSGDLDGIINANSVSSATLRLKDAQA